MQHLSKAERIFAALYLFWFLLHLSLFFYAEEGPLSSKFWPFILGKETLEETYDITEFLAYAVSPLIFFSASRLISGSEQNHSVNAFKSAETIFLTALLDEKIKAETLQQKINQLTNQPVNYTALQELKKDHEKLQQKGIHHWIDRVQVKQKYRIFEKAT